MNEEQTRQFNEMVAKVNEIYEWMRQEKNGIILIDENKRKTMGIGFIGKTGDTTPAGALLVNSPEGIIKLLYA